MNKYQIISFLNQSLNRFLSHATRVSLSSIINYSVGTPISAGINITKSCNSKCQYCLSWQIANAPQPTMDEIRSIVDSLALLGFQRIAFSGGEPLLRNDLTEMVQYAHQKGLLVNVLTNGLLATTSRICELIDAGLDYLTLSMDSINPQMYTFLRGIPYELFHKRLEECITIKKQNPQLFLSVHCVISKANMNDIPDLVKYLDERGVFTSFQVIHPIFNSRGKQIESPLYFGLEDQPALDGVVKKLIEMKYQGYKISSSKFYLENIPLYSIHNQFPEEHRCRAGYTSLAIDNHLNVYACWPMQSVGNLKRTSLEQLWYSRDYQKMRQRMWSLDCPKCWLSCHAELGAEARMREIKQMMRASLANKENKQQ